MTPGELEPLTEVAEVRSLGRHQRAYRAGERATHLFVVMSGQLKESVVSSEGNEMVFEIMMRGAVFGEPALFSPDRSRVVDVVAMARSEVVAIEREVLLAFLLRHPRALLRALEGLAVMVITSVDDTSGLAHFPIAERLLMKLAELGDTHGQPSEGGTTIRLLLSQSTLAASIGATRENVNRALRRLTESGLIRYDRGVVAIPDLEVLRAGLAPSRYRRNRLRGRQ